MILCMGNSRALAYKPFRSHLNIICDNVYREIVFACM